MNSFRGLSDEKAAKVVIQDNHVYNRILIGCGALLAITISCVIFCGCNWHDTKYKYNVEVTYLDNSVDTIYHEVVDCRGEPSFYIQATKYGFFVDTQMEPSLMMHKSIVVSGVRSYKILSQSKE